MLRVLVSGDQHIGFRNTSCDRAEEQLYEARFEALRNVVKYGNSQQCDMLALTGDLFHTETVSEDDIRKTAEILGSFKGWVYVLPGNHDFYSRDDPGVWKCFQDCTAEKGTIILLKENRPYQRVLTARGERKEVVLYPAACFTEHSQENCLGWIKNEPMPSDGAYRIGLAHGTLKGLSRDSEEVYYPMSREELEDIPTDVWLLGHAHVPYPRTLPLDIPETTRERIFNPGTHAQMSGNNNTEGCCFLLELEKKDGRTEVKAGRHITGVYRFFKVDVEIGPAETLKDALDRELSQFSDKSVVDLELSGTVPPEEYDRREKIIERALSRFADRTWSSTQLEKRVTRDMIDEEYSETSFVYKLLAELLEGEEADPVEVQLLYDELHENTKKRR